MNHNPLELATEDELFEELQRRFGSIILARSSDFLKDPSKEAFAFRWSGSLTTAIGLLERAKMRLAAYVASDVVD